MNKIFFQKDTSRNESPDPSLYGIGRLFSKHAESFNNNNPREGFREALKQRIFESRRKNSMPEFSFSDFIKRYWKPIAGIGSTVTIAAVIAGLLLLPFSPVSILRAPKAYAQDNFTLTAEEADSNGVKENSSFLLESRTPVEVEEIKAVLKTSVSASIQFEQISSQKIRLSFQSTLPKGETVRFSMSTTESTEQGEEAERPYSWAFQVESLFRVVGTIPGKNQSGVPLNSGIEFNFSHENIDEKAFEKYLLIAPKIAGHVERSRRIFVFVPDKALEPQTVYTVTLSKEIGLTGSDVVLGDDYTFQFETAQNEGGDSGGVSIEKRYALETPENEPVFFISLYGSAYSISSFHINLYRFSDYQSFFSALERSNTISWRSFGAASELADLSAMQKVMEFDAKKEESNGRTFFMFPKPLEEGYYIADIEAGGAKSWALISSSPLIAYVAKTDASTMVWANDVSTDAPAEGASLRYVGGTSEGKTDAQGLGYITEKDSQFRFLEVEYKDSKIALILNFDGIVSQLSPWADPRGEEGYWKYLYSDRPMYQPTDTLKFWGYAEDRDSQKRPKEVAVSLGEVRYIGCSPYRCDQQELFTFAEVPVSVSERGTFEGSLDIKNVPQGYYNLMVRVDGKIAVQRGISISEYIKPAYTLSVKFDKEAVFAGEAVGFTIHGEFFEGTPVKGLTVRMAAEGALDQIFTLDENGNASGVYTYPYQKEEESWKRYPVSAWITVRPDRPEEGRVETSASLTIFGPRVYIDIPYQEAKIKDGHGAVKLIARQVEPINSWDPKVFGTKTISGQSISGELIEITYTEREVGSYYDFISKRVIKQYAYDRVERRVGNISLTTGSDGSVLYEFDASNPKANYEIRIESTDTNGRTDHVNQYIWQDRGFEYWYEGDFLYFHNNDMQEGVEFQGYTVGEAAHLEVYQKQKPFLVPEKGRFLYFQASRGIQETSLSNSGKYEFAYEERDIPNVAVYGVFFNGNAYAEVGALDVFYKKEVKKISLEITPDKKQYRPGESIQLSIRTTDPAGKGVALEVNINVVDEAFYALMPEDVNPLFDLYQWVSSGILATQMSRSVESMKGGAEKGGGGGRGRYIFKDTAHFSTILTDAEGKGTLNFVLPDNITKWRVTAQALETDKKMAGNTKIGIDASLPFFLTPTLRPEYLEDDSPILLVRGAGTELKENDSIHLEFEVRENSWKEEKDITASETGRFKLPSLASGEYEITMSGKSGEYEDRLTRKIKIVPSHLVKSMFDTVAISDGIVIPGSDDKYTAVNFIDGSRGAWYLPLMELASLSGDRLDQIMVHLAAQSVLQEEFGEKFEEENFSLSSYQNIGLQLLPHSDDDLELTAKISMLKDNQFNKESLRDYIWSRLYYSGRGRFIGEELTSREVAIAYVGLSALGEPVLSEVKRFLEIPELGEEERLWGAVALHYLGDDEGARLIYRSFVEKTVVKEGVRYLPAQNVETEGEFTAVLGILSGALNEKERDELFSYIQNAAHGNTLIILEEFLMIQELLPNIPEGASEFSYQLRGKMYTQKLEKGEVLMLQITPEERASLNVKVLGGKVIAASRYEMPIVDIQEPTDSSLHVERSYFTIDRSASTLSFNENDLVKVVVRYSVSKLRPSETKGSNTNSSVSPTDAPVYRTYEVTDILPSGLAPVTNTFSTNFFFGGFEPEGVCVSFPIRAEGQRVIFLVDNIVEIDTSYCDPETLTYYARIVTPGAYTAEPVYIRSVYDPKMNNHSEETVVTIE